MNLNDFPCSKSLSRNSWNSGFTLIEVIIVIAIIGTISAIAVPNYIKYRYDALIAVAITDIRIIEKQIALFIHDNEGQFPDSLNNLPNNITINDPWGNPYQYLRINGGPPAAAGQARKDHFLVPVNSDYDLYSMGVDGQSQAPFTVPVSQDDIVRANDGGYVGLVSDY
jgi:general secretion pathway protein G